MTGTPVTVDVMRLTPADWRLFSTIRLRALADSLGADDPHYRQEPGSPRASGAGDCANTRSSRP